MDTTPRQYVRACKQCGSPNIVNISPAFVGIGGWGERCKDCDYFRDISAEVKAETDEEYRRESGQPLS